MDYYLFRDKQALPRLVNLFYHSLEAESAIKKIVEILKMNKPSTLNVVSCNVYLTDINQFEEFNNVYRKYFSFPFPSRTCVVVRQLAQQAKIEISVIASLN